MSSRQGEVKMKIEEIQAKSILVPSKLPDVDYVINPYTGCQFACIYCYASFMGRFVNEPIENWGNYVYVKINAVEVLRAQLSRWPDSKRHSKLLLSSVTDPYHGIEAKYRLTCGILEVLVNEHYPGQVSILTKSPIVLRDVDLLQRLPAMEVGLTVTTTDDKLSRFLEVKAPTATRRIDTLAKLAQAGIETYAFVGPLLPHFRYQPHLLDELFFQLSKAGVKSVYVEHINLSKYIKKRLLESLKDEPEEFRAPYVDAETADHRAILDGVVQTLMNKHGLKLRLADVLYHPEQTRK
jgi:DNA repair photolyase